MGRRHVTAIILALAAACAFACSRESPISPSGSIPLPLGQPASAAGAGAVDLHTRALTGSYELSFVDTNLEPVTTLTAGTGELVLHAHVANASGYPAERGRVVFEYCSLKGLPPNDIKRPDEAPSSACADGSGTWATLAGMDVDASGDAYLDFGIVLIPRTVGFRFRYSSQGSSVANGVSSPADFTWLAAQ